MRAKWQADHPDAFAAQEERRSFWKRFKRGCVHLSQPQDQGLSKIRIPEWSPPNKDRVSRLERALEAMGDSEAEVDGLRTALEKVRAETRKVEGPGKCSLHLFLQYQMWKQRSNVCASR